ncbi:Alkaline_phosphatase [Hexamita inflata]|uniref:Alkaline phosphatase n=1 Tax=Hexamita inflata TaxID=28002 RepID=A0AA86UEC5_9EUKA|nr:Alkaline phosphatase [Hexamita inflata]
MINELQTGTLSEEESVREPMIQNNTYSKQQNKWKLFVCIGSYSLVQLLVLSVMIYAFIYVDSIGYFIKQAEICAFQLVISLIYVIMYFRKHKQKKCVGKTHYLSMVFGIILTIACIPISIVFLVQMINIQSKFPEFCYGPLAFIHEKGTRIHWCTYKLQKSYLVDSRPKSAALSSYHNVFVNSTSFSYQIPGLSTQFEYHLPQAITKFIVISDTHTNTRFTSTMSTDFDFMIHCGDMSNKGNLSELQTGYQNWPTKPMLATFGNHDYRFKFNHFKRVNTRMNYYQQIRDIGVFFVYVQHGQDKKALKFLNKNAHLGENAEHVFIVVHNPVYATGDEGAVIKISKKVEEFIDSHQNLNIRAVFSGHNHVFAAFKREGIFYFVNGVGGGGLNPVYNKDEMGERVWQTESLHGQLEVLNDQCYGYEWHLDSWLKYTRTEVEFKNGVIVYSIRDLETNAVLQIYEQSF